MMMAATAKTNEDTGLIRKILERVTDPEIPVLTIADLGVLQDVYWNNDELTVVITPTYSGCPAMQTIEQDIIETLKSEGYAQVKVKTQLAPAWTTDWLSQSGREKLREFGIAPPAETTLDKRSLMGKKLEIACPQCQSLNTELVSEFGSTACKALYKCKDCLEPFDYFKCI